VSGNSTYTTSKLLHLKFTIFAHLTLYDICTTHVLILALIRTPAVRDRPNLVKAVDQWVLLAIVMGGQDGGRRDLWTKGFKKVNLHPFFKLPIEVWLSRISDKLVSSGGTESNIGDPYGPKYLQLIQVPDFYNDMTTAEQEELRGLTSHHDGFMWASEELAPIPAQLHALLKRGDNLYKFYKFQQEMDVAVSKGLANRDDLTPRAALERLRSEGRTVENPTSPAAQKQKNAQSMIDVGHHSYNFKGAPGLKGEALFKAMCLHRSRLSGNTFSARCGDLAISPDQEIHILTLKSKDVGVGAMLDAALDVNIGKGLATRKLNMIGEVDGVACIANDPLRMRRLRQVVNITSSIEDIKAGRAKLKQAQKAEKVKGKAAKQAKRDAELPLLSLFHDEELLEEGNDKITLPVLLSFVAKHSLAKYVQQTAGRGSTMSKINLMIFVTELCSQVQ
jgi:hypothetical protein